MSRQTPRRLLLSALCALFVAPSAFAAPIVSIQPANAVVRAGDPLNLTVEITDAVDLFAFQFDVAFDPSVLQATGPSSEGPFLATGGSTFFVPGLEDNVLGMVVGTSGALFGLTGVSGSGTLALLSFVGVFVPTSQTITLSLLNLQLLDSNLNPIAATVESATVTVNAVPEPASLLLLGSGLAVAWAARRRRRVA